MPFRKPTLRRLRTLCAEVHPDDGSDPRVFFRKDGSRSRPSHKGRQLCRQVAEALDGCFSEHSADDSLRDLAIVAVDPAPDSAHLLVTVTPRPGASLGDPGATLDQIDRAAGWLRAEVARAIRRKRAPLLTYRILSRPAGLEGEPPR